MLFHTWTFLVFILVVLPVFLVLRRTGGWVTWLLLASYVFYGWWQPYYLVLIFYSTVLDYVVVWLMDRCPPKPPQANRASLPTAERTASGAVEAQGSFVGWGDAVLRGALLFCGSVSAASFIASFLGPSSLRFTLWTMTLIFGLMAYGALRGSRRAWLGVSLINNLFLLFFFKYAGFFVGNANAVLGWLGSSWMLPQPGTLMPFGWEYLLPVGISFYTFQSLSYSIDFYRGEIERERSLIRFATFVAFFPQLVAGPIERSSNLLPQFKSVPPIKREDVTSGLSLFLVGLFKKLALANYLSHYAEQIYENPKVWGAPALLLGTVAFAWQIYFDFSGYTDMARGVGRLMGFHLMENFRHPYLATGLADFWGRWHISLSTWFRDYVYIPLGGNRGGTLRTYRNLFLTLLLSAVWHGAAWTFVIWGVLHALGLMITRELERSAWYRERLPRLIKQLATFAFVCLTWVFFRAESLDDAWFVVQHIFVGIWSDPQMPLVMLALIILIWIYEFISESRWREVLELGGVRVGLACAMILYMCLFSSKGGAFIYFQF